MRKSSAERNVSWKSFEEKVLGNILNEDASPTPINHMEEYLHPPQQCNSNSSFIINLIMIHADWVDVISMSIAVNTSRGSLYYQLHRN